MEKIKLKKLYSIYKMLKIITSKKKQNSIIKSRKFRLINNNKLLILVGSISDPIELQHQDFIWEEIDQ